MNSAIEHSRAERRTYDVHGLSQQQVVDVVHLFGAALFQVVHQRHRAVHHMLKCVPADIQSASADSTKLT